ncbi:ABC transporter permease [Sinosporangium siamense]|uniref:Transport permease protein n=1 Tax=Sinosporangium siamense TaxID=1367973 RepID=A0A919RHV1_9ACTN|nr:ABC transporter permease [Sinosporangium siamense]GII92109.1 transport permease protein [Sinosporangium siamense]
MRPFTHLAAMELKLLARDSGNVFFMVALPLLLLILNSENKTLTNFLPGYIAMALAIGGINTLPGVIGSYREGKVLRRLATTPISPLALLGAQFVAQMVLGLLATLIIVGAGILVFGVDPPRHPLSLALAFLLCSTMANTLGFLIASVARTAISAGVMGLMVMFPSIFLAGAAVPRGGLPESVQRVGDFLPLTYGVTALRQGWFETPTLMPFLLLIGIIVICTAGAAFLFRWDR